jgi:Ca-activated chloride channel family protein
MRDSGKAGRQVAIVVAVVTLVVISLQGQQQSPPTNPGAAFRFRSAVELINVTATVSDDEGRFVAGLRQEDFLVFEDDQPRRVTHFSAERVPVSLGIALDTSGSMAGEKMQAAQAALRRFLYDLLDPQDEIFLYLFSSEPTLVQDWTTDRQLLGRALGRIAARGSTAMYDTVAEALPLAEKGQHRKKALLVISDGNDTVSRTRIRELKQLIRETEVLVYAIGIDGESESTIMRMPPPRRPIPIPFPFPPGGRGRPGWPPQRPQINGPWGTGGWPGVASGDRVNVAALRDMTDESGGRTEIIRDPRDLNAATASIADELRNQYYLGYPSTGNRDGRWHSIRVEVRITTTESAHAAGYVAS